MNYAMEQFEKFVRDNCNYRVLVIENDIKKFGVYDFYFFINNDTIKITYKMDYSKSFEENLSAIKYKLLYVIFKK